eukprot:CAMPEP_0194763068 /NCGR_PEP_ID=MMETSP0323_2-20130528/17862_1 /TAXON_ID=2866 ORGANISM="Crypthecodinium cohnii, Strain Seligo" /NCGR_SAMPLE_ID=MMETSP0323_2 /ASSEMBLY_ACC=CAM_ASM_000346 /LENGTH=72 /DNA_ID=CAMNT_0039686987 /DNA_START=62 /DNA_END=280 /DNA_ORIENTATION=-
MSIYWTSTKGAASMKDRKSPTQDAYARVVAGRNSTARPGSRQESWAWPFERAHKGPGSTKSCIWISFTIDKR